MEKKASVYLTCLLITVVLMACGPSQAQMDKQATDIVAAVFATQTAAAPTFTPTSTNTLTPTPTSTLTPTPTQTPTTTPTFTPTPTITDTPFPLPSGWRDYAVGDFHIALPERWEAVDVGEEGIAAILDTLKGLNTEWAQNIALVLKPEAVQKAMKFWAKDSEPAGVGYATANVTSQPIVIPMKIGDLCTQMPALYKAMGVEMLESDCDLKINGLDTARFLIRLRMGSISVKEYQYVYLQKTKMWTFTAGVDATEWSEYEPVFVTAGESFRAD